MNDLFNDTLNTFLYLQLLDILMRTTQMSKLTLQTVVSD